MLKAAITSSMNHGTYHTEVLRVSGVSVTPSSTGGGVKVALAVTNVHCDSESMVPDTTRVSPGLRLSTGTSMGWPTVTPKIPLSHMWALPVAVVLDTLRTVKWRSRVPASGLIDGV